MIRLAALLAVTLATPLAAQEADCVGSYRVDLTFVGPDAVRPYMVTFAEGGTVIASPPGATSTFLPGGADVELSSPGHGVWAADGPGRCRLVVEAVDAYPDGRVSGVSRAVMDFVVTPEGAVTVAGTATAMEPEGAVMGELPIEGTGRRISLD